MIHNLSLHDFSYNENVYNYKLHLFSANTPNGTECTPKNTVPLFRIVEQSIYHEPFKITAISRIIGIHI